MRLNDVTTINGAASDLHARLAAQIVDYIQDTPVEPGAHLSLQTLADRLDVSRSPVKKALDLLRVHDIVRHEDRRGFFATGKIPEGRMLSADHDPLSSVYFRIAEDRLSGILPATVSEAMLRERYELGPADLKTVLNRILREGWIDRRRGYGWQFHEMLCTPDALEQTYRLRAALEPAALLEPGFSLAPGALDRLRAVEERLLEGEIETASMDALYLRGVRFHETIAEASGNPYILDALRRVNRIRRLLAYRSMAARHRYYEQSQEHLEILSLIGVGSLAAAADAMRHHLGTVASNLHDIEPLLRRNHI